MAKLEKLYVGQILHDYHRQRMGNTTCSKEGHWTAVVQEIDLEKRMALCSWNCNSPRWVCERTISKWKVKEKKARVEEE